MSKRFELLGRGIQHLLEKWLENACNVEAIINVCTWMKEQGAKKRLDARMITPSDIAAGNEAFLSFMVDMGKAMASGDHVYAGVAETGYVNDSSAILESLGLHYHEAHSGARYHSAKEVVDAGFADQVACLHFATPGGVGHFVNGYVDKDANVVIIMDGYNGSSQQCMFGELDSIRFYEAT